MQSFLAMSLSSSTMEESPRLWMGALLRFCVETTRVRSSCELMFVVAIVRSPSRAFES